MGALLSTYTCTAIDTLEQETSYPPPVGSTLDTRKLLPQSNLALIPNVRTWNHKVDENGVIEYGEGENERERERELERV